MKKPLEARRIEAEHRRELPEERPELVAQVEDSRGEEVRERLVDVFQPQQMRDVARALDAEDEARRRLAVPLVVILGPLQRVERAVELDRGKVRAAELELAAVGEAFGVPDTAPRLVAPAGNADPNQANFSFFQL